MRRRRKAPEQPGPKISPGGQSDVTKLVAEYRRLWKDHYGEEYTDDISVTTTERARSMVQVHGLKKLKDRLPVFFGDSYGWLVGAKHPLGYFLKRANQYGGMNGKAKGSAGLAPREPD